MAKNRKPREEEEEQRKEYEARKAAGSATTGGSTAGKPLAKGSPANKPSTPKPGTTKPGTSTGTPTNKPQQPAHQTKSGDTNWEDTMYHAGQGYQETPQTPAKQLKDPNSIVFAEQAGRLQTNGGRGYGTPLFQRDKGGLMVQRLNGSNQLSRALEDSQRQRGMLDNLNATPEERKALFDMYTEAGGGGVQGVMHYMQADPENVERVLHQMRINNHQGYAMDPTTVDYINRIKALGETGVPVNEDIRNALDMYKDSVLPDWIQNLDTSGKGTDNPLRVDINDDAMPRGLSTDEQLRWYGNSVEAARKIRDAGGYAGTWDPELMSDEDMESAQTRLREYKDWTHKEIEHINDAQAEYNDLLMKYTQQMDEPDAVRRATEEALHNHGLEVPEGWDWSEGNPFAYLTMDYGDKLTQYEKAYDDLLSGIDTEREYRDSYQGLMDRQLTPTQEQELAWAREYFGDQNIDYEDVDWRNYRKDKIDQEYEANSRYDESIAHLPEYNFFTQGLRRLRNMGGKWDADTADLAYAYANDIDYRDKLDDSTELGMEAVIFAGMTPSELADFNYTYKTRGRDAALAVLEQLRPKLNARYTGVLENNRREFATEGSLEAALSWGTARGEKLASALATPIAMGSALLGGQGLDPNSHYYQPQRMANASDIAQSQRAGEIWSTKIPGFDKPAGSILFDAITSSADSATSAAVGKFVGGAKAGKQLAQFIMSSNAAGNTFVQALEDGRSVRDAVLDATADGIIEAFTESASLDALVNPNLSMGAFRRTLQGAFIEGTEELHGNFLNKLYDTVMGKLLGRRTEHDRNVGQQLMFGQHQDGTPISVEEARGNVGLQELREAGQAFGEGALSGGLMIGGQEIGMMGKRGSAGKAVSSETSRNSMATIAEGLGMQQSAQVFRSSKSGNRKLGMEAFHIQERLSDRIQEVQETLVPSAVESMAQSNGLEKKDQKLITDAITSGFRANLNGLSEAGQKVLDKIRTGYQAILAGSKETSLPGQMEGALRELTWANNAQTTVNAMLSGDSMVTNNATVNSALDAGQAVMDSGKSTGVNDGQRMATVTNEDGTETRGRVIGISETASQNRARSITPEQAAEGTDNGNGNQMPQPTEEQKQGGARSLTPEQLAEDNQVTTDKAGPTTETTEDVEALPEVEGATEKPGITLTLETEDGRTIQVDADAVDTFDDDAVATIVQMAQNGDSGMTVNELNGMLSTYTGGDAVTYVTAYTDAFRSGYYNRNMNTTTGVVLNQQAVEAAQAAGRQAAQAYEQARLANVAKAGNRTRGTFTVDSSVSMDTLDANQQAGVDVLKKLSNAIGVNFTIFQSKADENGKLDGRNGWYDQATGTIFLDVNSGRNYTMEGYERLNQERQKRGEAPISVPQFAMLKTAAHELTHFIENSTGNEYAVLRDFMIGEYRRRGINFDSLVENMMAKRERAGAPVTREGAIAEVIADGCEMMLQNPEQLERLAKQDQSLFQKMTDFVSKLTEKVKAAFTGAADPSHMEARALMDVGDDGMWHYADEMQRMWYQALLKASGQEITADNLTVDKAMQIMSSTPAETVMGDTTGPSVMPEGPHEQDSVRTYDEPTIKNMSEADARDLMAGEWDGRTMYRDIGMYGGKGVFLSTRQITQAVMRQNGISQEVIDASLQHMDKLADWMKNEAVAKFTYIGIDDINNAVLTADPATGKITASCRVTNGEYPINIDFTKICNKRLAFQSFLNDFGMHIGRNGEVTQLETIRLDREAIFKMNEILRDAGYETACLGCFVEARRYSVLKWASETVDKWNNAVREIVKDPGYYDFSKGKGVGTATADQIKELHDELLQYAKQKRGSKVEDRMRILAKSMKPGNLKLLTMSDLVTVEGQTNMRQLLPTLARECNTSYGATQPKTVDAFTPYNSEIALLPPTWTQKEQEGDYSERHMNDLTGKNRKNTKEFIRSIGGVRSQSFSDFMIQHIMDVLQKNNDIAARKLTAQCYTKEIGRVVLTGTGGEKENMSVMFDIIPDEAPKGYKGVDASFYGWWHAGLSKDWRNQTDPELKYVIGDWRRAAKVNQETGQTAFTQSFPWQEAVAIEHDPMYGPHCGIIGVGLGYYHIMEMLGDQNIPYIIPYHSSGMPAVIKKATHINRATDYTPVQNTKIFDGFKVAKWQCDSHGLPSYASAPAGVKKGEGSMDVSIPVTYEGKYVGEATNLKQLLKMHNGNGRAAMETLLKYMADNNLTPATKSSKKLAGHGPFDLYGTLNAHYAENQETAHIQTADDYINWCLSNNYLPLAFEFSTHENYFKLLYDFSVVDLSNGGRTSIQGPVRASGEWMDSYTCWADKRWNTKNPDNQRAVRTGYEAWQADVEYFMDQKNRYMEEQFGSYDEENHTYTSETYQETRQRIIDELSVDKTGQKIEADEVEETEEQEEAPKKAKKKTTEKSTKANRKKAGKVIASPQFSIRDADEVYSEAVRTGDEQTAQLLVDKAAAESGYTLSAYHGTGEHFNVFQLGNEGIHLGNLEQANQVAHMRYENRSKDTVYRWGDIRSRISEMNTETRMSLARAAYGLGDYYPGGENEVPFDGDINDDNALIQYVDDKALKMEDTPEDAENVHFTLRTFDRDTSENVMHLYARINFPLTIDADILYWHPKQIANLLISRNNGETTFTTIDGDDLNISGMRFHAYPEDIQVLTDIANGTIKSGLNDGVYQDDAWNALYKVLNNSGYDGIKYLNQYEGDKSSYSYIALNPNDVKLADPITRDDSGNVIPLSERFNTDEADIRYSIRDDAESEDSVWSYLYNLEGFEDLTVKEKGVLRSFKIALDRVNEARAQVEKYQAELEAATTDDEKTKARNRVSVAQGQYTKAYNALEAVNRTDDMRKLEGRSRKFIREYLADKSDSEVAAMVQQYERGITQAQQKIDQLRQEIKDERARGAKGQAMQKALDSAEMKAAVELERIDARIAELEARDANRAEIKQLREEYEKKLKEVKAHGLRAQEIQRTFDKAELKAAVELERIDARIAELDARDAKRDEVRNLKAEYERKVKEAKDHGLRAQELQRTFDKAELSAAVELERIDSKIRELETKEAHKAEISRLKAEYERKVKEAKARGLRGQELQRAFDLGELRDQADRYRDTIRQIRSDASQRLLKEQTKYRNMIQSNRDIQKATARAARAKRQVVRDIKWLDSLIRKEDDYRNVPEELKPLVETLLSMVAAHDEGGASIAWNKKQAQRLTQMYANLISQDSPSGLNFDDSILAMLENVSDLMDSITGANRLTRARDQYGRLVKQDPNEPSIRLQRAEQLATAYAELADIVKYFKHTVRGAQDLFIAGKRMAVSSVNAEVMSQLPKNTKKRYTGPGASILSKANQSFHWNNLTPVYFFRQLRNDGLTRIFHGLEDGENVWGQRMYQASNRMKEIVQQYHYWDWAQQDGDVLTFKTQQGRDITLTREQAMSLYATWNREHINGMESHHLDEGGFVYPGDWQDPNTKKGVFERTDLRRFSGNKIDEADMEKISGFLTEEQKGYVKAMVDFLSTDMARYGNETSMQLYGIKKYKEKYYYPFKSFSGNLYQKSDAGTTSLTDDNRLKHRSFTKQLVRHANNAVLLEDFSTVVASHATEMITYSALTVGVENMNKVLNVKNLMDDDSEISTRSLIEAYYGKGASDYLKTFMQNLNGGVQGDNASDLYSKLISLFKKGAVAGSLSVAMQQPLSIIRAAVHINPKYLASSMPDVSGEAFEEAKQYAGTAAIKDIGGFDVNTGRSSSHYLLDTEDVSAGRTVGRMVGREGFDQMKDSWNNVVGYLPEKMDAMTWGQMWKAVKKEQADLNPGMDITSEEFLSKCGERFNEIMRLTQVYDSVLAKSANIQSKNPFMKTITAFMNEPTLTANMLFDAATHARENPAMLGKALITYTLSAIMQAMIKGLFSAARRDDKDKTLLEKWASAAGNNLLDEMNVVTLIPGLKDAWTIFQGGDVARADLSIISDLKTALDRAQAGKFNDPWAFTENVLGALSKFAGIPLKNIMRDTRALATIVDGATGLDMSFIPGVGNAKRRSEGAVIKYSLQDNLTIFGDSGKPKYYQMYLDAVRRGDQATADDVRTYLTVGLGATESGLATGMRNLIKPLIQSDKMTDDEAVDLLIRTGAYTDPKKAFSWVVKNTEAPTTNDDGTEEKVSTSVYDGVRNAAKSGTQADLDAEVKRLQGYGYTETQIRKGIYDQVKDWYLSGEISEAKAKELMTKYGGTGVDTEAEQHWTLEEWEQKEKYGEDYKYSKYNELWTAIDTGDTKTIKSEVNEILQFQTGKGAEDWKQAAQNVAAAISTQYKQPFMKLLEEGKTTEAANMLPLILDAYEAAGYDRDYELKYIQKNWMGKKLRLPKGDAKWRKDLRDK